MPKWGYAIVLALTALLAGYVFWPSGAPTQVAAFPQPLPATFTVTGELGEQVVTVGKIRVAGLERSANARAIAVFRSRCDRLAVPPTQVLEEIDTKAARAYGVDGSHRLTTVDEERTWGSYNGGGAIHDPKRRRLMLVEANEIRELTAAAARLDEPQLVELPTQLSSLTVDGTVLIRDKNVWHFPGHLRPPANGRIANIIGLITQARLAQMGAMPAAAVPAHTLNWSGRDGHAQELRLLMHAERSWLVLTGLPPQELSPAHAAQWNAACSALRVDLLCDQPANENLQQIVVQRDGREFLRLEHRGLLSEEQDRPWSVIWPGGDEPAIYAAGELIEAAVRNLTVTMPLLGREPVGLGTTSITIDYRGAPSLRLVLSDNRAWSDGWVGTANTLPPPLDRLLPDTFFDPRPCPIDPARVVKMQRRWVNDATRDEVMSRPEKGTWERRWPTNAVPADAFAVERIVRVLCRLHASAVRMRKPGEPLPAIMAEISLRIAPIAAKRVSIESEVELVDTLVQDRGWTLHRDGDTWLLAKMGDTLTYTVDAGSVDAMLADVSSNRLFPIAPSLVTAIDIGGSQPFRLERSGEQWLRCVVGTPKLPINALAARRLLLALTTLAASTSAVAPAHGTPISLETVDNERIAVVVGPRGTTGIAVGTTHGGRLLSDLAAWSQVDLRPESYQATP
ncbi:MAG: hypothetical protein AAB263_12280 [Planctomycetota bacterium]